MSSSGDSLMQNDLFQQVDGGAIPTSPLQFKAHQRIIRESAGVDSDLFGLLKPERIILKEALVKRISFCVAKPVIEKYEWIGTMPLPKSCRYMFGIYFDGILGGVAVFVHPSTRQFEKHHPRQVVQLNRGACLPWTPKNTASRLISVCCNLLKKEGVKIIIAYCTQEAGEYGTIYQACNFTYCGITPKSKVYFLDNHWVSERTLADKTKWALTKREDAWREKFKKLPMKWLRGKFRYIKLLASKDENEKIIKLYGYESLPYPKRK